MNGFLSPQNDKVLEMARHAERGVRWGHCLGARGHRGPGRPDYVNFFTILLSVRRYAMTVDSSQSQRNLKLQSTAEARRSHISQQNVNGLITIFRHYFKSECECDVCRLSMCAIME